MKKLKNTILIFAIPSCLILFGCQNMESEKEDVYKRQKQMDVMWKTKESPLKMEFYKNYLIYFMRKYKKLNTLILSVMVAGFLLCLVALGLFRVYANASLAEFSKLYQPRILFTNEYGSDHLDNIITMFQPEKQAMLDKIDVPYKAYPMRCV